MSTKNENEVQDKEIEVVAGDGSNLQMSPVYEHIKALKPKAKETKKDIIIPGVKDITIKKKMK